MTLAPETNLFRATIFHTPRNPFQISTGDPSALAFHDDGGLLVQRGRIVACGHYDDVRRGAPDAAVTDWRGGFLIPGLVDAHVHFPQVRIIGALGRTLLDWLEHVALPEEARMEDTKYAAATADLFVRALASHGTTTAMVFGAHFAEATATLFEAAAASGLRIASGLVVSDRSLRPELHQSPSQAYDETKNLIRRYHRRGRLLYAVTPRFAISTSEAMLEMCQQVMTEHPDVRLQTHVNENAAEVAEIRRLFPWAGDYLAVYERYGLSTARSVMAHNVHATDDELRRMATSGVAAAHCPASNAMLGSGIFPLRRHTDAGVTVALGTDVGGGTGFGILKEGVHAYLLQRLGGEHDFLDASRLLYLATSAGAKAIGLGSEVGDFAPGKAADFVYVRPLPESVLAASVRRANDPLGLLSSIFTLAGAESVGEVRVEGGVVYRAESL